MKSLIYIGMDVHSKTFSLCAYNPTQSVKVNSTPSAFVDFSLTNKFHSMNSGFYSYNLSFCDCLPPL